IAITTSNSTSVKPDRRDKRLMAGTLWDTDERRLCPYERSHTRETKPMQGSRGRACPRERESKPVERGDHHPSHSAARPPGAVTARWLSSPPPQPARVLPPSNRASVAASLNAPR